uniref:SCP domain-containing protein n=1 Tax=Monodelphis domestica TaxID=13616 RepID=A0A5F8HEN3_MONDO
MALRNFYCLLPVVFSALPVVFSAVSIIKGELLKVPYDAISTKSVNIQEEIVGKHNALRRGVIPRARNMLKMEWNEKAAQNARNWAKECEMTHSATFKRQITDIFCGENLLFSSDPLSWSDVIQIWYDESENFKYGFGPIKPGLVVGHYTQTVWSTSYMIGCEVAHCPSRETYKYFYVCHYCHRDRCNLGDCLFTFFMFTLNESEKWRGEIILILLLLIRRGSHVEIAPTIVKMDSVPIHVPMLMMLVTVQMLYLLLDVIIN